MCNEDALTSGGKTSSKVAIATTGNPPNVLPEGEEPGAKGRTSGCDCLIRDRLTLFAVCSITALSSSRLKRWLPVKLALLFVSILFVKQVGFAAEVLRFDSAKSTRG